MGKGGIDLVATHGSISSVKDQTPKTYNLDHRPSTHNLFPCTIRLYLQHLKVHLEWTTKHQHLFDEMLWDIGVAFAAQGQRVIFDNAGGSFVLEAP